MRILLTGSTGQVGHALQSALRGMGEIIIPPREQMDLSKPDLLRACIQQIRPDLIINPAAYSFTSIAIIDAIKIFEKPVIELHISNIHARDELHRHSRISSVATSVICGLGPYGYIVAMQAALHALGQLTDHMPDCLRPKFS